MDDLEGERRELKRILDAKRKEKRNRAFKTGLHCYKTPKELRRSKPKRKLVAFPTYEKAENQKMPPRCQGYRIVHKFGGARELSRIMQIHLEPSGWRAAGAIYKWTSETAVGGTHGLIPASAVDDIKMCARGEGIFLSDEDWVPGVR